MIPCESKARTKVAGLEKIRGQPNWAPAHSNHHDIYQMTNAMCSGLDEPSKVHIIEPFLE